MGAAIGEQFHIAVTSAATGITRLTPAIAFGDHLYIQTHQRAHIPGQRTVCGGDQHGVQSCRQTHDHLLDARILRPAEPVHLPQQGNLFLVRQRFDRIDRCIQRLDLARCQRMRTAVCTGSRDRARRLRGSQQLRQDDFVGIREAGFFAAHRTYADALFDGVAAVLDDAIFERPRFAARVLEIQIRRVDGRTHQPGKNAIQVAIGQPAGLQQLPLGEGKYVHGWEYR